MKTFAQRLQWAMQQEDVSQTALAAKTGIDITNICHLVHGRRAPNLQTLCKLLHALPNTDARKLLLGD